MADGPHALRADIRTGATGSTARRVRVYRRREDSRARALERGKACFRITRWRDGTSRVAGGDHRFLTNGAGRPLSTRQSGSDPHRRLPATSSPCGHTRLRRAWATRRTRAHRRRETHRADCRSSCASAISWTGRCAPSSTSRVQRVKKRRSAARRYAIRKATAVARCGSAIITTETEDFIANGVIGHTTATLVRRTLTSISRPVSISETSSSTRKTRRSCSPMSSAHPALRVCEPITHRCQHRSYQPVGHRAGCNAQPHRGCWRAHAPARASSPRARSCCAISTCSPEMAESRLVGPCWSASATLDDATKRTLEPRRRITRETPAGRACARRRRRAGRRARRASHSAWSRITSSRRSSRAAARRRTHRQLRAAAHAARDQGSVRAMAARDALKAEHVMSLMRQMHGGRAYDPTFGPSPARLGAYAELLARRFEWPASARDSRARAGPRARRRHRSGRHAPGGQLDSGVRASPDPYNARV